MHQHSQLCKPALANDDDDWEEESDNGGDYDEFEFGKD